MAGAGIALLLVTAPPVGFASSEDPVPASGSDEPAGAASGASQQPVALDRLLQLPDSYGVEKKEPVKGGATASDWRARFDEADTKVAEAKQALAEAQRELEAQAVDSSQWQISAPGVRADAEQSGATGLAGRQRVRRHREEVENAERRRRALDVEADLARVPDDWRK